MVSILKIFVPLLVVLAVLYQCMSPSTVVVPVQMPQPQMNRVQHLPPAALPLVVPPMAAPVAPVPAPQQHVQVEHMSKQHIKAETKRRHSSLLVGAKRHIVRPHKAN